MDRPIIKPVFRNPDKFKVLSFRELIRQKGLAGREGIVVEDIDLVVLRFGPLIERNYDEDGQFLLAEAKYGNVGLSYAQKRTFSLLHKLLRMADPKKEYYLGFFLIQELENSYWRVNGKKLTEKEFIEFIEGKIQIPSLFD